MDPEEMYFERLATRAEAAREALAERGIAIETSVDRVGNTVTGISLDFGAEGAILMAEALVWFCDQQAFESDMEDAFEDLFGDGIVDIDDLLRGDDDD